LPWHVAFLLNLIRSTRLVSATPPPIAPIMFSVDNFICSTHWRHHFLRTPARRLWYRSGRPPSHFPFLQQPEVTSAGQTLKAGIGEAFCRALANARREGAASWSNRAPAIRRAWSWLRSSPFFAVPRDKGGGWVLAERSAFVNECRRIVDTKGWYTRTNIFDDFSNAFAHMKIEYKLLCDSMSSHLAVCSCRMLRPLPSLR
jgi:hypothetical protein